MENKINLLAMLLTRLLRKSGWMDVAEPGSGCRLKKRRKNLGKYYLCVPPLPKFDIMGLMC